MLKDLKILVYLKAMDDFTQHKHILIYKRRL